MNKKIWAAVLSGILVIPIYCTGILKQDYNAQAAQEIQDETTLSPLVLEMSKESGCYPEAFSLDITCEGAERIYTNSTLNQEENMLKCKYEL